MKPGGHAAVMERRTSPPDALDHFPTPPWATRALFEFVLKDRYLRSHTGWDPCAGEGHMAEPMREYLHGGVSASDVWDYGKGYPVEDFLAEDLEAPEVDFICMNPPFVTALEFTLRALEIARRGVCVLQRTTWSEGGERYERLFKPRPPTFEAIFSERVSMNRGRWDPKANNATSYTWFVWLKAEQRGYIERIHIPPGQKHRLTLFGDARRFGHQEPLPLFEETDERPEPAHSADEC